MAKHVCSYLQYVPNYYGDLNVNGYEMEKSVCDHFPQPMMLLVLDADVLLKYDVSLACEFVSTVEGKTFAVKQYVFVSHRFEELRRAQHMSQQETVAHSYCIDLC